MKTQAVLATSPGACQTGHAALVTSSRQSPSWLPASPRDTPATTYLTSTYSPTHTVRADKSGTPPCFAWQVTQVVHGCTGMCTCLDRCHQVKFNMDTAFLHKHCFSRAQVCPRTLHILNFSPPLQQQAVPNLAPYVIQQSDRQCSEMHFSRLPHQAHSQTPRQRMCFLSRSGSTRLRCQPDEHT